MTSGIALIGNPGTGKSCILNGLVGEPVFSSGLSFATGRTTTLQEHNHQGRSFFDTPGLDDIDRRKEAGAEIDRLLRQNTSLKIAFVVFALNGRVRSEDTATVRLVLDAITSVDTNDRFGVIINQMPVELQEAININPIVEKKVRMSITGSRYTSHWCYVLTDDSLRAKENGLLKTPELHQFFNSLPETKPDNAEVQNVDVTTFEEKLQEERRIFEEREKVLRHEMETQRIRMNTLEMLNNELTTVMEQERNANELMRQELQGKHEQLEAFIETQKAEIDLARDESKLFQLDLKEYKQQAEAEEQRAREKLEAMNNLIQEEKSARQGELNAAYTRIRKLEKNKICTIM